VNNDARSDAELLASTVRGDGSAFGVLVRRHVRSATLLAVQLLGDRDDAEDVVQEAFGVVYRDRRRFDAERPFAPWLFAIVRRLATNKRSRDARRAKLLRRWAAGTAAQPAQPDIPATLDARLDAAAVQRAMPSLSPMQRACFDLVAVRNLSIAEVATMHGIAESTVRQHVFRARTALRRALESPALESEESLEPEDS
jgi:RNA polymerase sigma-70 factor (ECF subfamily)